MRRLSSLLLLLALPAIAACGQEIVVVGCDGHEDSDATNPRPDAGDGGVTTQDTGADDRGQIDSGVAGMDAQGQELGPDGGVDPCTTGGYCLRGLTVSAERANVREPVTFTPMISNPNNVALTFSVRPQEITGTRRANRPAFRLQEITVDLSVDPATGVATFSVTQVPPWFIATTMQIKVYAKGPNANDPEVSASAEVHIRGNTVFTASTIDGVNVYAVASDGRPARAITPGRMRGELITDNADEPRALLMANDGTLLVYDYGVTPSRILRFELTGENVQIGSFEHSDNMQMPYLSDGNSYPYSLAQLNDGRIATVDYNFSRQPRSRIVLWNPDGTFNRIITPVDPNIAWSGVGVRENGEILAMVRDGSNSRIMRIDPTSGQALTPDLADTLQNAGRVVLGVPGGDAYAGLDGAVMRVSAGGVKIRISTLPTQPSTYWRALARYADGQILAANDNSSGDSQNIAVIENRDFVRWLRPTGVGGANGSVYGIAYLE